MKSTGQTYLLIDSDDAQQYDYLRRSCNEVVDSYINAIKRGSRSVAEVRRAIEVVEVHRARIESVANQLYEILREFEGDSADKNHQT